MHQNKINDLSKQILASESISPIYTISKTFKPSLAAQDFIRKELEWASQFCSVSVDANAACSQYFWSKKSIVMVSLNSVSGISEEERLLSWKNMLLHEIAHNKFGHFRFLKIVSALLPILLMFLNVLNAIFLGYDFIYITNILLIVVCLFTAIVLKSLEEMVCESVSLMVNQLRGDLISPGQLKYIKDYAYNISAVVLSKKWAIKWALKTANPIARNILSVKR